MDFKTIVANFVDNGVNPLASVIFALAFMYFLFGVLKYIQSGGGSKGGDPKAKASGVSAMVWGLVGMAFMFSLWGFVRIGLSFFTPSGSPPVIQQNFDAPASP